MSTKEIFVEKLQRQSREILQKLREEKQEAQREQQKKSTFCSLGLQIEVHHFHLIFIIIFLLKNLLYCLGLKKLFKQIERTIEIAKKIEKT
jgi:hypothetical protein